MFLFRFYLGANGDISLSLAQRMVGGGTLWTSHGRVASSPSVTDSRSGSTGLPAPSVLDLGRTVHKQQINTRAHTAQSHY